MIKTLGDFQEALDKMMEERGYKKRKHIQLDRYVFVISDSSPAAPDTVGEISMEVILVPPRSEDKRRQE